MGYPETEKSVNFTWWYDKVHPKDIMDVKNEFSDAINGDTVNWRKTYRFKTYDGSFKYLILEILKTASGVQYVLQEIK